MPVLRPYQSKAVSDCRGAMGFLAGPPAPLPRRPSMNGPLFRRPAAVAPTAGGNVLLVVPTGGGKTVIFSEIARLESHRRVLIVAHRRELIRQASAKLRAAGVAHGVIAPGHPATNDNVQVGSVQTLVRRTDRMRDHDLIIFDEAHHSVAGAWKKIIDANPKARILGPTASPERMDGKGLGRAAGGPYDVLIAGPTIAELQADGHLVRARVYGPAKQPNLDGIRLHGGDYAPEDLVAALTAQGCTGDAVEHYARICPGQPAIAFCASVAHAEAVAAAFRAAGWRAVAASGETPTAQRDAAIAGLGDGSVQVLCAADLISEGLDIPAVAAVILLRPTKSLGLHIQQVGRGLRPADGKQWLTVLDHAGNSFRHGLPDEVHAWSLDGRKKKDKQAISIKQCHACFAIHPPAPACPCCGVVYAVAKAKRQSAPKVRDGVLEELTAERVRLLRETPLVELLRSATSQRDLHQVAKARGFKPGWAHFKWQERGGHRRAA